MKKKKTEDKYDENACEFKNESECDEDLDEDMIDKDEEEKNYFEEDKDSFE